MKRIKRHLAGLLAAVLMMFVLTGCGDDETRESYKVQPGETVSSTSKWIDSDIDGALDETIQVSEKDDFHTAVNAEWILQTPGLTDEVFDINFFTETTDILRERKLAIVTGEERADSVEENPARIPADQQRHAEELVRQFVALAGDWDARNALGAEPLRLYVEAVGNISSLEELTAYWCGEGGPLLVLDMPLDLTVGDSFGDHTTNSVCIDVAKTFSLGETSEYTKLDQQGMLTRLFNEEMVFTILGDLGWADSEIRSLLRRCYALEIDLAVAYNNSSMGLTAQNFVEETTQQFTLEELKDMAGDFPVAEILARYGMDNAPFYTVSSPGYVKAVGRLYTSRLEDLKAWTLVHLVLYGETLLDRGTYDRLKELQCQQTEKKQDGDPDSPSDAGSGTEADKEADILLEEYVGIYLSEPLDQVYISRYCTAEQKAQLQELVDEIIACYRTMLQEEAWLTEQTRNRAVEKLDSITAHVLYPDTFHDYSALDLDGCVTLPEAVSRINAFRLSQQAEKVGTAKNRSDWDLSAVSTTEVNAYYLATDNSITILAGLLAGDRFLTEGEAREERMGTIGVIIGHEITHAFDINGAKFDKDGNLALWWEMSDLTEFSLRSAKVQVAYSSLIPYPGSSGYAAEVAGEATADMGGVKCMLEIAKGDPDFDYQLFFRSYAGLWRTKRSYDAEDNYAQSDTHPLAYMRTNMVVWQFDEFQQAFDIQEGDGMYLPPEKRVLVW